MGVYEVSVMAEQLKPSWGDHFFPVGLHYYAGVVENAKKPIERRGTRLQLSVLLEREAPQGSSPLIVQVAAKKIMMKQLHPV